jgi:hypothetical protein
MQTPVLTHIFQQTLKSLNVQHDFQVLNGPPPVKTCFLDSIVDPMLLPNQGGSKFGAQLQIRWDGFYTIH